MEKLKELADKDSHLDKTHIGYIPLYEMLFDPIRQNVKKLLEIGIQYGKSLRLWRDFFQNATIYGWDINPQSCIQESRICSKLVNHDDKQQVISNLTSIGNDIDIIIDDGSHRMNSQQMLFPWCLPFIRSGGLYITEDIGTSFPARGQNYGLKSDGSNGTYKVFDNFLLTGIFESEYVSGEDKKYVEENTKNVMLYSTIRKFPDYFSSLPIKDWPTFPIFVITKR